MIKEIIKTPVEFISHITNNYHIIGSLCVISNQIGKRYHLFESMVINHLKNGNNILINTTELTSAYLTKRFDAFCDMNVEITFNNDLNLIEIKFDDVDSKLFIYSASVIDLTFDLTIALLNEINVDMIYFDNIYLYKNSSAFNQYKRLKFIATNYNKTIFAFAQIPSNTQLDVNFTDLYIHLNGESKNKEMSSNFIVMRNRFGQNNTIHKTIINKNNGEIKIICNE